jgi:hypothetical protein
VLRIHNDLIHIILSPLRWVIPAANQISSLLSGRQWDVPAAPEPAFISVAGAGSRIPV